ncbi:MAG: entericidin A/B family lipoprotein [Burkholderiales bacterium]|nr:entericidin A/B family lipoprotein [Phycisphaerae bacterium]
MELKTLVRKIVTLAVLFAGCVTLTACNTMDGAGRDIERGGEKLQDAAD